MDKTIQQLSEQLSEQLKAEGKSLLIYDSNKPVMIFESLKAAEVMLVYYYYYAKAQYKRNLEKQKNNKPYYPGEQVFINSNGEFNIPYDIEYIDSNIQMKIEADKKIMNHFKPPKKTYIRNKDKVPGQIYNGEVWYPKCANAEQFYKTNSQITSNTETEKLLKLLTIPGMVETLVNATNTISVPKTQPRVLSTKEINTKISDDTKLHTPPPKIQPKIEEPEFKDYGRGNLKVRVK